MLYPGLKYLIDKYFPIDLNFMDIGQIKHNRSQDCGDINILEYILRSDGKILISNYTEDFADLFLQSPKMKKIVLSPRVYDQ